MSFKSKPLFLLGICLISLSSLLKWMVTGSIEVDNNPVPSPWTWPVLFVFYSGLVLSCVAYYKIVLNEEGSQLSFSETSKLAVYGLVASFFMAPMLAADMAGYLAYGDIAQAGQYAYVNGEELLQSKFIDWVSPHWKTCPNHYGPFLLLIFYICVLIGKSYILSLIFLKIAFVLFGLLFIHFAKKLTEENDSKYNILGMIILCPIIFVEGIGQLHVDFMIAGFLMASVYYLRQQKWWIAAIFIGLVGACKYLYLVVFLAFLISYLFVYFEKNILKTIKTGLPLLLLSIGVMVLFYVPVWEGVGTLISSMEYHAAKNPTNSIVKVFALIVIGLNILFSEFQNLIGGNIDIDQIVTKFESIQAYYFDFSKTLFKVFGLSLAIWNFIGIFFMKNTKELIHLFAKVLIIVICFFSPQFYPWYLMIILPFFIYEKSETWIKYIAFVFPFTLFYEALFPTLRGVSPLVGLYLVFVFAMVFLFFKHFKKHFIMETYGLIQKARL